MEQIYIYKQELQRKGNKIVEDLNDCFLDLRNKIVIKDRVTISTGSKILTHLDIGKSELSKIYTSVQKSVIINNNCFIGAGATILMGVEMGENCMVAAGSMVTKSFPANSLISGVPAKLKKKLSF